MKWFGALLAFIVVVSLGYRYRVALLQRASRTALVVGLIVIVIAILNYVPLLPTHTVQDECAFGPVSNEKYLAYLSEARSRQRTKWPAFSNDDQQIGRELRFRLSDMLAEDATAYERIATMHAILRAIGAEYLNANGRTEADPFEGARKRRQDVEFNYRIDISRLGLFQLYPRTIWIIASIPDPDIPRPEITRLYGDRSISAATVSVFDHPPSEFLTPSGQSCPPSPSTEVAERYRSKKK
jgi:hypothetical protein